MKTKTTAMKTAKSAAVKKTLIALAVALMCFGAYFLCMTAAVRNTGAQSTPNWNNETGVFTYTNDTSDSSWRNASIPLPSNLYGMFAYDNSTLSVADLTGVKGLLLNAQNDGIAYAWELGIEDMRYTSARMGNSNYQWQSTSGNGSGIFLPDSGTPYYANVNTIPAGFHGQIFIPFQALQYDLSQTAENQRYSFNDTYQNRMFMMRGFKAADANATERATGKGTGVVDTADNVQYDFPTAAMARNFTWYSAPNSTGQQNVTLSDFTYLDNTAYNELLARVADAVPLTGLDAVKTTSLSGAPYITSNATASYSLVYRMQSAGGSSAGPSLNDTVALAVRVNNIKGVSWMEIQLNPTNSEQHFMFNSSMSYTIPFLHTDGRTSQVLVGNGVAAIPEGYDGTMVVPYRAPALYGVPNTNAALNGRVDGNIWQINFGIRAHNAEQEFAIGEIAAIHRNGTVLPFATTGGTTAHTVKDLAYWPVSTANFTIAAYPAAEDTLTLVETTDSAESHNAALSAQSLLYAQSATLTVPKLDGKSVIVRLNGARLTGDALTDKGTHYEYVCKKTDKTESGALDFTVDYHTGYAIAYHNTDGAVNNNPAMYSALDTGSDKIILVPAAKPGYVLLGWYEESNFTTLVTEIDGAAQIGQIDLYARWQELSVAVAVPEKYHVASTYGDAADLSGVTALAFDVNNSTGAAYKFSLGIFDRATEGNAQNEWVNDGNVQGMGSGLFIPTGGRPYWGNVNNIPAGFTGRIVVPLATRYYNADGANDRQMYGTYDYYNNPAFKMRASMGAAELGVFDADGTQRAFPTATMARSFTMTVDGANYSDAVLSNAAFLDGESAQGWEYYMNLMRDLPAVTSLNGLSYGDSVYFNQTNPTAGYYGAIFQLKSASNLPTTTTTSLDGALGMAVRITNTGANPLGLEIFMQEASASGEQLFLGRVGVNRTLKFVFLDGTVGSVAWNGRLSIPAGYDGTLIIPFSDFTIGGGDANTKNANQNARLNGVVWAVRITAWSTLVTE